MFFFFLLMSCESYLYDDYKIIDYKRKLSRDYTYKDNLYKVRKGDNLFSISRRFNISIQELIKVNKILQDWFNKNSKVSGDEPNKVDMFIRILYRYVTSRSETSAKFVIAKS